MRRTVLVVAVLAAAFLTAVADSQEGPAPKTDQGGAATKVKDLQQQRIATLKEIVEAFDAQRQNGRGSFEDLIEAKVQLLTAELEVASSDAERVTICENIVKQFVALEELAQANRESARGSYTAVLKAKARRLEAEISFERAKSRAERTRLSWSRRK